MGYLLSCQVQHLGFCLIILLALSLCYGNHVAVDVEGFIACAHCIPVGVASSGTGLLMNIECKSRGGDLRKLGAGEVDYTGNFKIKFLQDKNIEDQIERGICFLKLDGASGAPWPVQEVQNVLVMISKSIDNVKQTSAMIKKLKFSSIIRTSASPSPKPTSFNYKPSPAPMSSSPKPLPPPTPILKKPVLPPMPLSRMPLPSRPNLEKPLPPVPPPMPHLYKPIPPMAQAPEIRQFLPPLLAPYIQEPPAQPTPTYKNAPPPHSQRLVHSTAPAPMAKTPHFPPLAPTYKNLIPVPAPTPHLKTTIPPVAPIPTYKKPTIPPPMHSPPGPILKNPNPPPVPTFKKSAPPPHPSLPVQQPNAPLHPPISPAPIWPPSPKPAHKSAPIINPAPTIKQPPSTPASGRKSFYPIPKAPPIPKLPPVPIVPRRYFNIPKYGSQPSSPPS